MRLRSTFAFVGVAAMLGGCATVPTGPAVTVMPGTGKTFEAFQQDQTACQQYAYAAIGGANAGQPANDHAAGTALVGSAWGAGTGAIIGSATSQAGQGAAIGAGVGLLFGALAASNQSYASSWQLQRNYDGAYMQCMYAHGNQVPVRMSYRTQMGPGAPGAYPPPNSPAPYPPPNTPPPAIPPPDALPPS